MPSWDKHAGEYVPDLVDPTYAPNNVRADRLSHEAAQREEAFRTLLLNELSGIAAALYKIYGEMPDPHRGER